MECKYCNTVNTDDAVFCKNCGKRIDGKIACPACKKSIDADATYCNYCGKRIDGKKVNEARSSSAAEASDNGEITVPRSGKWKTVLNYVGTALALFVAVIAHMFVFSVGFSANNSLLASQVSVNLNLDDVSIYYYLGTVYEDIITTANNMRPSSMVSGYSFIKPSLYIPTVICTVISAGMLIAVTTLSIIAVVKLIRKLVGKEVVHAERYAFASFFTYVLGAALLRSFHNATINAVEYSSYGNTSVHLALIYNSATITGIVLGTLGLAACLGCRIATQGAALKNAKTITSLALTAASLLLVGLVVNYASSASHSELVYQSGVQTVLTVPTATWLQLCAQAIGATNEPWNSEFFLIALTMFVQLGVIALAGAYLIKIINKTLNSKEPLSLMLSITLTVACAVYMTLSAIASVSFAEMTASQFSLSFVSSIVTFVFALFNLGVAIARHIINKRNKQPVAVEDVPVDVENVPIESEDIPVDIEAANE